MISDGRPVLLTGATGYVGGRLAPRLREAGYPVRCLARTPAKLGSRSWIQDPGVAVVEGDLNDPDSLRRAMDGCSAAYYLVHSMKAAGRDYAARDRELAERFAGCAAEAGLERIIYLGGLGEMGEDLSEHLRSRREVEEALASGPVPLTVLRASVGGTPPTLSGRSGASWIAWREAPGFDGGAGIPRRWRTGRPWTSGGSQGSRRTGA